MILTLRREADRPVELTGGACTKTREPQLG